MRKIRILALALVLALLLPTLVACGGGGTSESKPSSDSTSGSTSESESESTGTDWSKVNFDGEDLIMTVREATGFTNTFHDGKYLTFYRVKNFRSLLTSKASRHQQYWMD